MSVPSIEELVAIFCAERDEFGDYDAEAGLLAVLDRLKPVVAEAAQDGVAHGRSDHSDLREFGKQYAARIIDQIKGT